MMLRTEKLSKRLGGFSLREISLAVARGDYYVLLGRSGAGKTQLLELICGLIAPDRGKVFLDGEDITNKRVQQRSIGMVFQDLALFPHYTVRDNIMYPLKITGLTLKERVERLQQVAEDMDLNKGHHSQHLFLLDFEFHLNRKEQYTIYLQPNRRK